VELNRPAGDPELTVELLTERLVGGSNKEKLIAANQLRSTLSWFMQSNPWPLEECEQEIIEAMLNAEAQKYGYKDWVAAFHTKERR